MTQAFNLSQLANNLNTSGQLDATDGLTGAVPVANGGTGATVASTARTNLGLGTLSTLSPSGTANSTTYLRGDNTWATVSTGGVTSLNGQTGAITNTSANAIGSYIYGITNNNQTLFGTRASTGISYLNNFGSPVAFPSISGTWRCMGGNAMDSSGPTLTTDNVSLWVRVS